ncbi:MAG: efflux RND transporter permease subunit [Rhodospirillales bacterium]
MGDTNFFIARPIFSGVISIIITLAGLVASQVLPIAQYPEIAPQTVLITANYPGASAETLAKTVAAPIEEQLNGVENMSYFTSTSSSNGALTISRDFRARLRHQQRDILVNNRVQIALPRLPDDVRRTGVVVQKRSTDVLMAIGMQSDNPRYDTLFLSNYSTINIVDELKRLPGVGDTTIFGARDYSMRVWMRGPTAWRSSASPPPTSPMRSTRRTRSSPPARWGRSRWPAASPWCIQ